MGAKSKGVRELASPINHKEWTKAHNAPIHRTVESKLSLDQLLIPRLEKITHQTL